MKSLSKVLILLGFSFSFIYAQNFGNTTGKIDVVKGKLVYNLPLKLPKSNNPLQKNLSIVYNQGGDRASSLGHGWGISGLESIKRAYTQRYSYGCGNLIGTITTRSNTTPVQPYCPPSLVTSFNGYYHNNNKLLDTVYYVYWSEDFNHRVLKTTIDDFSIFYVSLIQN